MQREQPMEKSSHPKCNIKQEELKLLLQLRTATVITINMIDQMLSPNTEQYVYHQWNATTKWKYMMKMITMYTYILNFIIKIMRLINQKKQN